MARGQMRHVTLLQSQHIQYHVLLLILKYAVTCFLLSYYVVYNAPIQGPTCPAIINTTKAT